MSSRSSSDSVSGVSCCFCAAPAPEKNLASIFSANRASRDETKTFTYKKGGINYIVTARHLQMGFVLKRAESDTAAG